MTTVDAAPAARGQHQTSQDRIFYSGMAILMALTVFIGFAPTFYLRAWFDWPLYSGERTMMPLAYVHGAVFSGWVVLFIVQTALVATRQVAMHRRLGVAGILLAAGMVVVGLMAAFAAAARGAAPPGVDAITFLAVPFFKVIVFTAFVSAAIWRRRNRESHKRLMLLVYLDRHWSRRRADSRTAAPWLRGLGALPGHDGGVRPLLTPPHPPRLRLGRCAAGDLGSRNTGDVPHRRVACVRGSDNPLTHRAVSGLHAQGAPVRCDNLSHYTVLAA